ncbi:integrase core domain-containing protein [Magnetococcus marinus]|uniref:integrase core domain-containing protein n=1 Tax=Magnetococcus marinus TaxID=1124597 RepID=UPI001D12F35A|nr:integrase core domain-containing protein [Magnetococcus marinus]
MIGLVAKQSIAHCRAIDTHPQFSTFSGTSPILALRHQINILRRQKPKRPTFSRWDKLFWVWLSRRWSGWKSALVIIKPATVVKWHKQGFKLYWKWKSQPKRPGRPRIPKEVRDLIRKMSRENPLWGAPRIHGELLKLDYDIGETSVSKYMLKPDKPPSQTWRTFLDNHVNQIVAMDFFTIPTIFFKVLHVLILIDHDRRRIIHFNVTTNPTSAWVVQQIREAFPWDSAPRFLLHDHDPLFMASQHSLKAMGIETLITAPGSPWQNAIAERMIGSCRRECFDHIIVLNEEHLRQRLGEYVDYYHQRTHLGLAKDSPVHRPIQHKDSGDVIVFPVLGGLHHRYERIAA